MVAMSVGLDYLRFAYNIGSYNINSNICCSLGNWWYRCFRAYGGKL